MGNIGQTELPVSEVNALFAGRVISFNLSNGATFADLADGLNRFCDRYADAPQAIFVKFGPAGHLYPAFEFDQQSTAATGPV
jgi:hypothetical protein